MGKCNDFLTPSLLACPAAERLMRVSTWRLIPRGKYNWPVLSARLHSQSKHWQAVWFLFLYWTYNLDLHQVSQFKAWCWPQALEATLFNWTEIREINIFPAHTFQAYLVFFFLIFLISQFPVTYSSKLNSCFHIQPLAIQSIIERVQI